MIAIAIVITIRAGLSCTEQSCRSVRVPKEYAVASRHDINYI